MRIITLLLILLLAACAAPTPSRPDDVCQVFQEFPDWYKDAKATQAKWDVPVSVQMAIIYHESAFKKNAKPPRTKLLWVIPWTRPSTAYSYSQALNQTWDNYKINTGNTHAQRSNFADASDFVGWFCFQSHRKLGLSYNDAYAQYLAYHEGWGGYAAGTYNSKTWLIHYAERVQSRATLYNAQLQKCQKSLDDRWSWF